MITVVKIPLEEARELFVYQNDGNLEYGTVVLKEYIYEWLEKNTLGEWSYSNVLIQYGFTDDNNVCFNFDLEEDAVAFKLRWT